MASKYAKPLRIPPGFPDILRSFTREILRQQGKVTSASEIYHFGVEFFANELEKQQQAQENQQIQHQLERYVTLNEDEIQEYMEDTLRNADHDNSEFLDHKTFRKVRCPVHSH